MGHSHRREASRAERSSTNLAHGFTQTPSPPTVVHYSKCDGGHEVSGVQVPWFVKIPMKLQMFTDTLKPFDRDGPPATQCLEQIYSAFEQYAIDWAWCPQCFSTDDKQRMRPYANTRKAPPEAFSAIFNEHPECSGGATTFLHWLPRGIETQFFSEHIDPSLTIQMFRLGMISWPDHDVEPLRQFFCGLSLSWWRSGDIAPALVEPSGGRQISNTFIGQRLCGALCALRVDMGSAARVMLDIDTPSAWWSLLGLFRSQTILEEPVYYVVDSADEATFRKARAALDRCARLRVGRNVTRELLIEKWEKVHTSDPALADAISEAETYFDFYKFEQSDADIAADQNVIKLALQSRSPH